MTERPRSSGGSAYKLISADGHYVEPGDLFTSRIASKWHDRLPRIESFDEGDARIGGFYKQPSNFGWFSGAGRAPEEMNAWMRWSDVRPGGYDGKARLAEMDADGVDAEVIFPGLAYMPTVTEQDPELHLAMVRAYNDWILEFSGLRSRHGHDGGAPPSGRPGQVQAAREDGGPRCPAHDRHRQGPKARHRR